jgi:hypothetical protein
MGFKTYHDLWDESYDFYQGPERWQAIQRVMQSMLEKTAEEQQQLLRAAHDIALHNRRHLNDIVTDQKDLYKHDYKNI